jgi:hypothetical protein
MIPNYPGNDRHWARWYAFGMNHEGLNIPPPPPVEKKDNAPVLKERIVQNPEELSAREFSKSDMAAERTALAAEITQERRQGRDEISELKVRINLLSNKLESSNSNAEQLQQEIENLEQTRTTRANSLTGRVKSFLKFETSKDKTLTESLQNKGSELELTTQEKLEAEKELEDSMGKLADADTSLLSLRNRIPAHYAEAGENMQKTVEQTMLRNNVFFVHTINEDPRLRHNANSNISAEATFEDDIDILLSLEPSLSASTLKSGVDEEGKVSGLWSQSGGVLLSGGKISAAHEQDIGTLSQGIKSRYAFSDANKSAEKIDSVVNAPRRANPEDIGGYNELVVDNPEISGYFKPGAVDENGAFWAGSMQTRESLTKLHELYNQDPNSSEYADESGRFAKYVSRYKERFDLIKEKGLPFYVMTPDRKFFEVQSVNENGSLQVGAELTPEAAAQARAGLTAEKRKEVGKKLLEREVFRTQKTKEEAASIVENL